MYNSISIVSTFVVCVMLVAMYGCGASDEQSLSRADSIAIEATQDLHPDSILLYSRHLDEMPDSGCVKMKINYLGGTLGRVFNDVNRIHLAEARMIGIDPIGDVAEVWRVKRPLRKIVSCREYFVDSLTHSHPFLVPEAANLLKEVGHRFNDSLRARGGGCYRLKVTSVLRTERSVGRLRRRNVNSVESSAHLYGTTFDISYSKFICDTSIVNRTQTDLKNLLGEVLFQLRKEGKCYVKYERKQACFHITARRPQL